MCLLQNCERRGNGTLAHLMPTALISRALLPGSCSGGSSLLLVPALLLLRLGLEVLLVVSPGLSTTTSSEPG